MSLSLRGCGSPRQRWWSNADQGAASRSPVCDRADRQLAVVPPPDFDTIAHCSDVTKMNAHSAWPERTFIRLNTLIAAMNGC
jgi:hypothetical protein